MIETAVQRRPNDGAIVDSLGWVMLRQGEVTDAVKTLERAVELDPAEDGRPEKPLYVVIEKIAASHEKIPESWAVHGTSGYRYAVLVNGVLVDSDAGDEMEAVYRAFAPDAVDYDESVYRSKHAIMGAALAAPLAMLGSSSPSPAASTTASESAWPPTSPRTTAATATGGLQRAIRRRGARRYVSSDAAYAPITGPVPGI